LDKINSNGNKINGSKTKTNKDNGNNRTKNNGNKSKTKTIRKTNRNNNIGNNSGIANSREKKSLVWVSKAAAVVSNGKAKVNGKINRTNGRANKERKKLKLIAPLPLLSNTMPATRLF